MRAPVNREGLNEQLDREKRAVSYDVYDMTVRQLVDMVSVGEIEIAPDYQRHFIWDSDRESELIESIYLGIPVPSLYMAANRDGTWEVVDGVQRLSTLVHFCGSDDDLAIIRKQAPLSLSGLNKLTAFNRETFRSLPRSVQLNFTLRPVRVTTLNDKSDFGVRYDLFERLNTGGVKLHPQEIRNCVFRGEFMDLIKGLAREEDFRRVLKVPANEQQAAIYEECVLRFFAFFENHQQFEHSVVGFLNDYMEARADDAPRDLVPLFRSTMRVLAEHLPNGIVRGTRSNTPLNLYEAIAVGAALTLQEGGQINEEELVEVMNSDELRRVTTGATNSRRMVNDRIHLVRANLLA